MNSRTKKPSASATSPRPRATRVPREDNPPPDARPSGPDQQPLLRTSPDHLPRSGNVPPTPSPASPPDMNTSEYYKRIKEVFRPEELRGGLVFVVGAGSTGSRVALELGRLGVTLVLVDRPGEVLEEHNIVRHVLGYRSLGKSKVAELAALISDFNRETKIVTAEIDVVAEPKKFAALIATHRPTLIASCTDDEGARRATGQASLAAGIPMVGGAVYDGGVGGEVYLARNQHACYACIAAQTNLAQPAPVARSIDYSSPFAQSAPTTAALNLDIERIAGIQASVALSLLVKEPTAVSAVPKAANFIVFANRPMGDTFPRPLHAEFFTIARDPDCLVCRRCDSGDLDRGAEILGTASPGVRVR